jgi:hypothetical protein
MLQEQRSHDSVVDNIGTVGSNGHEAPDQEDALQELKTIVMYYSSLSTRFCYHH